MTRPAARVRYEYTQTIDFAEVQRLGGEGWQLAGVAVVSRQPGHAEALYVMQRPALRWGGAR